MESLDAVRRHVEELRLRFKAYVFGVQSGGDMERYGLLWK